MGVTEDREDKGALLEILDLREKESAFEVGIG